MATAPLLKLALMFVFVVTTYLAFCAHTPLVHALSGCGGSCRTLNDCSGQLICINGKCNDDPDVGTHICGGGGGGSGSGSGGGSCAATSENPDTCCSTNTCLKVSCSPPITTPTAAILTLNDFSAGGDGGGPSECDNSYHSNSEAVVALSTGWYSGGSRCNKRIRIYGNGRSTTAKVVDECDSLNGCDAEHDGQPPCRNNIVDASAAVWSALGVSTTSPAYGEMAVTWQDV